jgi:pectate lyase
MPQQDVLEYYKARGMGFGEGTTGGAGGKTVEVKTGDELQAAANAMTEPTIFRIPKGAQINGGNTKGAQIDFKEKHNFSVVGSGENDRPDVTQVGFRCIRSSNFWFDNLAIERITEGQKDCIGIEDDCKKFAVTRNRMRGDMKAGKDDMDGLVDIKKGSEFGFIADNDFGNHHKVSLIGHTDSAGGPGTWHVTYNRNLFDNVGSRCPSVRGGVADVVDNYFRDVETTGINCRMDATVKIRGNAFENVDDPIVSTDSKKIGYWDLDEGNDLAKVTWGVKAGKSSATAQDGKSTCHVVLPEDYRLERLPARTVKAHVLANVGPRAGALATPAPQPELGQGGSEPGPAPGETGSGGETVPPQPGTDQPNAPAEEEPEVVDLGPIAVALDEAEAAIAKVRRLLGAG